MKNHYTIALIALMVVVALLVLPVSATDTKDKIATQINSGATVFIGEQGLDITGVMGDYTEIAWFASGASTSDSSPSQTITISKDTQSDFYVSSSQFGSYTGSWYLYDGSLHGLHEIAFYVDDPNLDVQVWDRGTSTNMNSKTVVVGENLTFKVLTNMYTIGTTGSKRLDSLSSSTSNVPVASFTVAINKISGNVSFVSTSSNSPDTYTWEFGSGAGTVLSPNTTSSNVTMKLFTSTLEYAKLTASNSEQSNITTDSSYKINNIQISGSSGSYTITTGVIESIAPIPTTYTATSGGLSPSASLNDGFISVYVKPESGSTYTQLYNAVDGSTSVSTENLFVNSSSYLWNGTWATGAYNNGQRAYPAGTYKVWAESKLNDMKDNYKTSGGADYTGKTISTAYTITIVSDTLKITSNKESVVRSNPFSVTITGTPQATYNLWVKGTNTMDGYSYNEVPPQINDNQEGVVVGSSVTASYPYQNGAGNTVSDNTPNVTGNSSFSVNPYYANVTLSDSGTRTVEFITTANTKSQKYTIRIETNASGFKSDELDVKVEEGTVTIVAAGDQSYYLGEEIKFSGTNTESSETYLFITGPNLEAYGSQIQSDDPRNDAVENGNATSFEIADVESDNTWEYKWGTASIALDAGTYTVYAVSQAHDKDNLENTAYGTVSIVIKKPFISATTSSSTVAKGDRVYITGTAQGQPSEGVMIWILGKNYETHTTESVNSDASFSYEIQQTTTADLSSGQYFVVAQHPMQNNQFDVYATTGSNGEVVMTKDQSGGDSDTADFKLTGANSLQGSDAAEALIESINDANVDDTYTKLQFLVEEPLITVADVGTRHVGDKFTITASTNLAVDDEILCEVYSSSFSPTQKTQSGEFSGATGTVKVEKGTSGTGLNTISFDVDASTFKADEYLVTFSAIIQEATGTTLFNVLDASAPSATTAAPVVTVAATPVATAVPIAAETTAVPTTTKTPTQPGFGALVALIGLGAVALIVVRRH